MKRTFGKGKKVVSVISLMAFVLLILAPSSGMAQSASVQQAANKAALEAAKDAASKGATQAQAQSAAFDAAKKVALELGAPEAEATAIANAAIQTSEVAAAISGASGTILGVSNAVLIGAVGIGVAAGLALVAASTSSTTTAHH